MPERPGDTLRSEPESKYSRSVEYGIAILRCFTVQRRALRISELAELVGISRSSTHRYAMTLVKLGWLEQDQKRRYMLSYCAPGPGRTMINTIRLETPAALRILEDLREQTGYTVSMAVLEGTQAVYTHRLFAHGKGQYDADLGLRVGAPVPAYCTAIGKALLASLSAPDQREILARLTLKRHGPKTITSKRVLAEELLRIQTSGIALSDHEQASGVRSIAAAITHPGRSLPMALSVTIPTTRQTLERLATKLIPHIENAAERI